MCGKDLGGIWMPGAKGSKTYIPLRCNSKHSTVYTNPEEHFYYDSKSGNRIVGGGGSEVIVDERGCVVDNQRN